MVAICIAGALALAAIARHQWFFGEDWSFLAARPFPALFPHNGHWTTGFLLVSRGASRLFGLGAYLPYVALLAIAHVGAIIAAWLIARRSGGGILSVAILAALIPLGVGHEALFWYSSLSLTAPTLIGMFVLLALDRPEPSWRCTLVVAGVLVISMTLSGVALTTTVAATLLVASRRMWSRAAIVGGLPMLAFSIWYVTWGVQADAARPRPTWSVVAFTWEVLLHSWASALHVPRWMAALVIAAVVAGGVRAWRSFDARAPLAAATAAALFALSVSLSRAVFGLEEARASRYATIVVLLSAPALAVAITTLRPRVPTVAAVTLASAVVATLGAGQLAERARAQAPLWETARREVTAALPLIDRAIVSDRTPAAPHLRSEPTVWQLRQIAASGRLPTVSEPTPEDRLNVEVRLLIRIDRSDRPSENSCIHTSSLTVPGAAPGTSLLIAHDGGLLVINLARDGTQSTIPREVDIRDSGFHALHVATRGDLHIDVGTGEQFTACLEPRSAVSNAR